MAQSLEEMAEELTCSICLSLFSTPVTISCGHNFCLDCLEQFWNEEGCSAYTCPQCRFSFPSKPELKKNTLLSNLVSLTQAARVPEGSTDQEEEEEDGGKTEDELEAEGKDEGETVMCDSCRNTPATKTCLTCMAAFCSVHLLPHLESPAFTDHQLTPPLRDLQARKCPEHNKLMDHYCWEHSKCICCYCALNHKSCKTHTLEEAKKKKEMHYTTVLRSLNQKVDKTTSITEELQFEQRKVMERAKQKKEQLEVQFEEIKALIDEEWKKAVAKIEAEERKATRNFSYTQQVLGKKKKEFEFVRNKVQSLLQEQDDLQFLKRATKMRDTTTKEPFKPRIEIDQKLLQNIYRRASTLKETVKLALSQPDETPEQKTQTKKAPEAESGAEPGKFGKWKPPPLIRKMDDDQPEKPHKQNKPKQKPFTNPLPTEPMGYHPNDRSKPKTPTKVPPPPMELMGHPPNAQPQRAPRPAAPPDSREQLLRYAEKLSLDPSTAHKKILMADGYTKMAGTNTPQNYQDNPFRFVNCSQVLCAQGFSGGVHYWEVEKEGGNFSGFGVAYESIPCSGADSRLGRNKVSWCLEWCNGKLQAWHDDKQTDLTTPNASRFGVLLNYNEGFLSFYCHDKIFSQIYKFRATFTEAVYPAFWIFSNDTVLTLCQDYTMEA